MTKHTSIGFRNKLKSTAIKNRERFQELKITKFKTPEEWQEFHSLKEVLRRPYHKKFRKEKEVKK